MGAVHGQANQPGAALANDFRFGDFRLQLLHVRLHLLRLAEEVAKIVDFLHALSLLMLFVTGFPNALRPRGGRQIR